MVRYVVCFTIFFQSAPPGLFFFKYMVYVYFSLTKVKPPIFEWAVLKLLVHLWVEIMVLLSMILDWIFQWLILNSHGKICSLLHYFFSKCTTRSFFFFKYMVYVYFSLTKVKPPIFEWAVLRLFVHLWVEIMVLLSMILDWIFQWMILNSHGKICTCSLPHYFFSKCTTRSFFFSIWSMYIFSLTKVKPPIFEWAVLRLFVHLWVEIMVLLSMILDWIFQWMILNSHGKICSLPHYFFSKCTTRSFFFF